MDYIDPNRRETQRNYESPRVDPHFTEELTRIGGVNRYGQPNLRAVWGQERKQWALGDPNALLYIDTRLDPIIHERHTLRRISFIEPVQVPAGIDVQTGQPVMETREVRHYEIIECEPMPKVIPAGWLYACEQEYEWIGEQLFYIEQYVPPEAIVGGEARWNAERFAEGYHLLTGKFDPFLDHTGPFPREGDYESRLVIGEPYLYPVHEDFYEYEFDEAGEPRATGRTKRETSVCRHMRYRELGRDVLDALRASVFERDHRSERKSAAQRQRNALAEYRAREEKKEKADRDYTRRTFKDRLITAVGDRVGQFNPAPRNRPPAGKVILTGA